MSAQQEILDAQVRWAKQCGLEPHPTRNYYLASVKASLWRPLSSKAFSSYRSGAGSELKRMNSLRSSATLVVNVFDYWTERDKTPLLSALGVGSGRVKSFDFEAKFHTEISSRNEGTPPHLDVAITLDSGHLVAIESKFMEPYSRSTDGSKSSFRDEYFRDSRKLWKDKGLPACQVFARELQERRHRFEFLDAAQLLKHALGLATQCVTGQFSLYYLYYDWCGESDEARKRANVHKKEIDSFAQHVGKELRFKVLTYQEVYSRLCDSLNDNSEHKDYLEYLRDRYFLGKGAAK